MNILPLSRDYNYIMRYVRHCLIARKPVEFDSELVRSETCSRYSCFIFSNLLDVGKCFPLVI